MIKKISTCRKGFSSFTFCINNLFGGKEKLQRDMLINNNKKVLVYFIMSVVRGSTCYVSLYHIHVDDQRGFSRSFDAYKKFKLRRRIRSKNKPIL